MLEKNHKPVGKRALLGAILARHIDPQVSLLAMQPALAAELADASGTTSDETTPDAVEVAEADQPKAKPSKKDTKKPKQATPEEPTPEPKRKWWQRKGVLNAQTKFALLAVLVFMILGAPLTLAYAYYQTRVMPGVSISGIPVGGKTVAEVRTIIQNSEAGVTFSIADDDKVLRPSAQELGVTFNTQETVDAVLAVRRHDGPQNKFAWWKHDDVPLHVSFDRSKVAEYEKAVLQTGNTPPVDAKVVYDKGQYTAAQDVSGKGRGIQASISVLEKGITKSGDVGVAITDQEVAPKVKTADLDEVVKQANNMVATSIVLTVAGKTYQPTRDDIHSWLAINTDPEKQPYTVKPDDAKIGAYVELINKQVYVAPVNKVIMKNQDQGGSEQVLTQGKNGRQLKDKASTASAIIEALKSQKALAQVLTTEDLAFKTDNINVFDRYVDVDISDLRLVAYEKGVEVATFPISTGDAYHKTPPGEYTIFRKTRSQTMYGGSKAAGDYFYLPNVEYISWFYGEYSIHGAYWNKFIGIKSTSHGCVNMTNADAGFIYDWAPVGTKVVIHA